MKRILYITPQINKEGGLERVLSIKTNYLIEKLGYDITILTQNSGNVLPFYSFNKKIKFYDMELKGSRAFFLWQYNKQVRKNVRIVNPEIIVVVESVYKAFALTLIMRTHIPMIFEYHGSKNVQENEKKESFYLKYFERIIDRFKNHTVTKYVHFVVLSNESKAEWNTKDAIVIPNPNWLHTDKIALLQSKKVIAVARHSYEKGLDRLLYIWRVVSKKHPDWILEIYGKSDVDNSLMKLAKSVKIAESVFFYEPVQDIEQKYLNASVCVMTSRTEGLPMVLIEAMSCGLPCVAYDCPCGPRSSIADNQNGFLIEDGNASLFAEKLILLIESKVLREQMGKVASESGAAYDVESVMKQWQNLFESLAK
ncbi:glycosyltransferase family 4 protein [Flavobacterium sp. ACAM 123]|uniref:glycosyltransferase family 4 protein n=1 Tax=Flavobacterium sp. ACAM 123 TaxID=1189620 RepID=UPI0002DF56C6|nr:glycosyltransferase family 4 protein [Flavobacterium sp. ACAM 123]